MKTVTEDLMVAKALIQDPARWVKGSFFAPGPAGNCYCALGAVGEVMNSYHDDLPRYYDAREALADAIPGNPLSFISITTFNDDEATTHQDVMDLFDRAIDSTLETA